MVWKQQAKEESCLSAEGGRRLFSAALPGSVGPKDVVEARHSALNAKVFVIVHGQFLAGQLFQAVRVLGLHPTIPKLQNFLPYSDLQAPPLL